MGHTRGLASRLCTLTRGKTRHPRIVGFTLKGMSLWFFFTVGAHYAHGHTSPGLTFTRFYMLFRVVNERGLEEIRDFLSNPAKYRELGAKIPKGEIGRAHV